MNRKTFFNGNFSDDAEVAADGKLVVDIFEPQLPVEVYRRLNLELTDASISVYHMGHRILELTWTEADEFADALKRVTGVARNG